MEFSLHRELKEHYATHDAQQEVKLGPYRIDVVRDGCLIEIQHGSLAAIRDKVRALLKRHSVLVVKPIIARRQIVKYDQRDGRVLHRRWSPKRGRLLDLFDQLVYFTRVFPNKRLTIEVPLVEIQEHRVPGHGRRRRWRKNDFQVVDQRLMTITSTHRFHRPEQLWQLLPVRLPDPFDTEQLARQLEVQRWIAQRIAYCLRETGAAETVGKRGNTRLYRACRAA